MGSFLLVVSRQDFNYQLLLGRSNSCFSPFHWLLTFWGKSLIQLGFTLTFKYLLRCLSTVRPSLKTRKDKTSRLFPLYRQSFFGGIVTLYCGWTVGLKSLMECYIQIKFWWLSVIVWYLFQKYYWLAYAYKVSRFYLCNFYPNKGLWPIIFQDSCLFLFHLITFSI